MTAVPVRMAPAYMSSPQQATRLVSTAAPMTVTQMPTVQTASYSPAPLGGATMSFQPMSVTQQLPVSSVISGAQAVSMSMPLGMPQMPAVPGPDGNLQPPPRLTSGLPDPQSIAKQREQYLKALEEQERQAIAVLEQQRAQQVGLLRAQGEQQKEKFFLEVNQQVSQNDIVLTQQHSEQMMVLNQQYSQQRGILENQANTLIMEFQQKKAQEEMMMQHYQLQCDQFNQQQKYNDEMVRLQGQRERTQGALAQAYASSYMPPPLARQNTYLPAITGLGTSPVTYAN
jgi:hypothetical protein